MILSGISFIIGLITSLFFGRSIFMKLCDAEFMRIKNYDYNHPDFFKGMSPEKNSHPIYTNSDLLQARAQQMNDERELCDLSSL